MLLCKGAQLKHAERPLAEGATGDAVSLVGHGTGAGNKLCVLSLHHTQIFSILALRNALVLVGSWLPA